MTGRSRQAAADPQVLVTVVIPAFNRARTLPVALRSIQAQTVSAWEAIVVDDGSRDATAETAARFAEQDPRIRMFRHHRNRGAQAARNTGIGAARGRWVGFLDSDDEWLPDSLALRLDAAAAEGVQVVHSEGYQRRNGGVPERHAIRPLAGWCYRELLRGPGPMFQALLLAPPAAEAIGALDESLVALQEWDTAIRLAERFRFGFVSAPTFVWSRGGADTITEDRRRDAAGYEQVVRKHLEAIVRCAGRDAAAHHFEILAARFHGAGQQADAFRCLCASRRFRRSGHEAE